MPCAFYYLPPRFQTERPGFHVTAITVALQHRGCYSRKQMPIEPETFGAYIKSHTSLGVLHLGVKVAHF